MSNYRRNRVPSGCYFFNVNLFNRQSGLLVKHIGELRAAVRQTKRLHPFHIDAWVVLPDHLHCVWTLPENDADYSRRWKAIKKAFSKSIPPVEPRTATQTKRNERSIWQRRFWEHTIMDERDYAAHIDYIHYNPVKDWPYSTFHQWVEQGVYPPDWAGCDESIAETGEP